MTTIKNYIFYKIVCDDLPEFIYVGSTSDYDVRKRNHKNNINNENYNFKIYNTIRENGGWENWKMIQIHQEENINKTQAKAIEEEYRLNLNANLNERRAFRSLEVKKELAAICNKNYQQSENGKQKVRERQSKLYVCGCGKELTFGKKARHEKSLFHLKYINNEN